MMHVRLPPLPESRWARIAQGLAYVSVPVALVAILLTRSDQIAPEAGVALIALAAVIATAALSVAVIAAIEIWRHGVRGLGAFSRALIVAALVLAAPAWLALKAIELPPLNDITTDIEDPPVFSTARRTLAARGDHRQPDISRGKREEQARAYPGLRTIVLDNEPEEAFRLVQEAVKALRWRVIEEIRPDDRRGLGQIEAIAETRLMRFRDDITIRLRWTGSETRVDIRSASRVGRHDFGTNAARIARFQEELSNLGE